MESTGNIERAPDEIPWRVSLLSVVFQEERTATANPVAQIGRTPSTRKIVSLSIWRGAPRVKVEQEYADGWEIEWERTASRCLVRRQTRSDIKDDNKPEKSALRVLSKNSTVIEGLGENVTEIPQAEGWGARESKTQQMTPNNNNLEPVFFSCKKLKGEEFTEERWFFLRPLLWNFSQVLCFLVVLNYVLRETSLVSISLITFSRR